MKGSRWLGPALLLLAVVAIFAIAGIVARFILLVPALSANAPSHPDGRMTVFWPNGHLKSDVTYRDDVYHGEVRTYYESGAPFELRHYVNGHEEGVQQSWTDAGVLYLNYEVHDGRRFGLVNPSPCNIVGDAERRPSREWRGEQIAPESLEAAGADTSGLPYYDDPDFTPHWTQRAHTVAPFTLVTQSGASISGTRLRGRPYVASFIYTECAAICPLVTRQLSRVQAAVAPGRASIVSFSVTPEKDTPERLASFGRERGVDPRVWSLVTGDKRTIYSLARTSYFAADPRAGESADDETAFLHSEKLLLVDGDGHLRGVYNGTQPHAVDQLLEDLTALTAVAEQ